MCVLFSSTAVCPTLHLMLLVKWCVVHGFILVWFPCSRHANATRVKKSHPYTQAAVIHFHLRGFCSNEHSFIFRIAYISDTFFFFISYFHLYVSLAPFLFISIRHPMWNTVFLGRMSICHERTLSFQFFFSGTIYMHIIMFIPLYAIHTHSLPHSLFSISVLFIISTFFPVFIFNKFHFIEWHRENKKGNWTEIFFFSCKTHTERKI